MTDKREVPYGAWPSPISIESAVSSFLHLAEVRLDGDDVYWTEGRPQEGGRQVIVRWNEHDGQSDVTPAPFNARTMAHEYGGGWYAVDTGTVWFVNMADGRIYVQERGASSEPRPLTAEGPYRHGDLTVDRARGRLLCVREDTTPMQAGSADHSETAEGERPPEPVDLLTAIDLESGEATTLASGYDFYSTPRPSPDGSKLAWLAWRHPNMPWDTTELWVADVAADGGLANERMVAGGGDEAVVQPEWAPDGTLVYVSDKSGWWNLYRLAVPGDGGRAAEPVALTSMEAEFAGPLWVFGLRWYGIAPDGTIVASANARGRDTLMMIPAVGGPAEPIAVPDEAIDSLVVSGRRVAYIGGGSAQPRGVVMLDLDRGERRELKATFEVPVGAEYISTPEAISFPTTNGDIAHALYYPPTNPDVTAPDGELPPLIVTTHGGPTSQANGVINLGVQVFTSRGFGVVDVNYRGSTGYGREFMRKLDDKWGIYDVDDAVAAARYLADRGEVDPKRMGIRGASAGGYTTLCAVAFHDVFAAGASYFGVGDLEALARFTHKYESRYLDRLVAPYPSGIDVYRERSPIYAMDRVSCPLIVLQGEDDMVVPKAQAEQIVASLRERKVPHAYLLFPGEGHGFRQAAHIRRSLEAELSFYGQVFGFQLADDLEPVPVENLARS
ncbi:MAG TPA: S9 family peptidase [Aeromicrobium sp.]|nr:S9 family peptidase [Aeromicrobium sp.]